MLRLHTCQEIHANPVVEAQHLTNQEGNFQAALHDFAPSFTTQQQQRGTLLSHAPHAHNSSLSTSNAYIVEKQSYSPQSWLFNNRLHVQLTNNNNNNKKKKKKKEEKEEEEEEEEEKKKKEERRKMKKKKKIKKKKEKKDEERKKEKMKEKKNKIEDRKRRKDIETAIDPKWHGRKVPAIFCALFQADSQDTSSSKEIFLGKKQTKIHI